MVWCTFYCKLLQKSKYATPPTKSFIFFKTKTTNGFEVALIFGFLFFPSVSFLPGEESAKTPLRQTNYYYSHSRSRKSRKY